MNNSHFQRGSGSYTCRSCGRKTRATGRGDNENIRLCVECYDLMGMDNHCNDTGESPEQYDPQGERFTMLKYIADRGGDAYGVQERLEHLFPSCTYDVAFAGASALGVELSEELNVERVDDRS